MKRAATLSRQKKKSSPVVQRSAVNIALFSPTHKRTEGRAPVWGSEFTSKRRRTTRGDPVETAARLNVKLRTSVTGAWWWFI